MYQAERVTKLVTILNVVNSIRLDNYEKLNL